jgi:dihydropyrimidinase
MIDLSIVGGTVVTDHAEEALDVHVDAGRVVALTTPGTAGFAAREVVDASGLHVLPGVVEPHAHIGIGGQDDWRVESASAVRGGVTTVFNYVMGSESYHDLVRAEHEIAGPNTHIDYGLHVVPCTPQHLDELDSYVTELGINSFKYFMSFRGEEGRYLGISGADDGYLFEYLTRVAAHPGAIAAIHAENIEIVWRLRAAMQAAGGNDLHAWNRSRPDFTEAEGVARAAFLARVTGTPTYFVHMSAAMSIVEAKRARAAAGDEGPPLYLETGAQYLTHTEDANEGVIAKLNPPLRSSADRQALWAAIERGDIEVIGSDHAPRHVSKKSGTVWEASNGVPGIGMQLTILLSEGHHRRGLPLTRIVALTSANPARIFGVYPTKGALLPGSDADITLVDLALEKRATADSWGGGSGYNLYEGWDIKGWPVATFLRGTPGFRNGEVVSAPGTGRYLPRREHEGRMHEGIR